MTVEELLRPRTKVIAPYPGMSDEVGDVIELDDGDETIEDYKKYPHLFKFLKWWEEREEKDMPEYVKSRNGNKVAKLIKIDMNETSLYNMYLGDEYGTEVIPYAALGYLPATKEEYESQNKKVKK